MVPPAGFSSPAISLSKVDLPEPFTPIRPVRPGPKDTVRPSRTGAPSGQLELRSEQVMAADIRRGSQHVGKFPVRVATPRRVGSGLCAARVEVTRVTAVSLTSQPQRTLLPPTAETVSMLTRAGRLAQPI